MFHGGARAMTLRKNFERMPTSIGRKRGTTSGGYWNNSQPEPYYETHALPSKSTDTQQYYELIGKYHQFVYGWDDVTADFSTDNKNVPSSRRLDYETRRNDSNKYLKRASVVTGLAVLNHIASAIHASAYTRTLQKKTGPSLWIDITPVDSHGRSMVELKTRF